MATSTTNLGLTKPAGTDKIRIAQINGNMDILDEKIGAVGNTSLQAQVTSQNQAIANVSNLVFPASVGTEITSATDFNTFVSPGVRTFSSNTTISNSANKPCSYAGRLVVWTINGSNLNTRYGLGGQIYIDFSGNQYTRSASADASGVITWGSWNELALKSEVATRTFYTPTVESDRITYDSSSSVVSKNGILCCNIRFSVNTAISTSPTVLGDIGVSLPHQMQFAGIKGDNTVVRLLVTANGGLLTYSPLVSGDVVFLSFSMILNG